MTFTLSPTWQTAKTAIEEALVAHLSQDDGHYDSTRLHYGADLSPEVCARKIWYRLNGWKGEAESLGTLLRFWGGKTLEGAACSALETHSAGTQVLVRRSGRPSLAAKAFDDGHADLLLVPGFAGLPGGTLLEIKAPRAALFHRAGKDARRLVKPQYAWQLSAYFHELKRQKRCDRAAFLFLDREGANAPELVPLEGELLISEEDIREMEEQRANIVEHAEAPARIDRTVTASVWKGKGKTPKRIVKGVSRRNWQCGYCSFASTCQPGAEETEATLSEAENADAIARAEATWRLDPKKRSPLKFTVAGPPDDDEDTAESDPVDEEADGDPAPLQSPVEAAPAESKPVSAGTERPGSGGSPDGSSGTALESATTAKRDVRNAGSAMSESGVYSKAEQAKTAKASSSQGELPAPDRSLTDRAGPSASNLIASTFGTIPEARDAAGISLPGW